MSTSNIPDIETLRNILKEHEEAKQPVATVHVKDAIEAAKEAVRFGGQWICVTSDNPDLMRFHLIPLCMKGALVHHYAPGTEHEDVIKATDAGMALLLQWNGGAQ
jgi:hypothetical protein